MASTRIDCDGCKLTVERQGDELYFTMYYDSPATEMFMGANVRIEELKSTIRMLETEE